MNPQAGRWYEGLPDVTAEFHCAGQPHRIVWRRGKLVLEDHDLLAERTLVALGSEPPLCVEVLDAWLRMRGPELLPDLLAAATVPPDELASRKRSHVDAIARGAEFIAGPAQILRGLLSSTQRNIDRERRMWAVTLLHALPVEFRCRLALAVIVELQRHWHDEAFRSRHREHVEPVLAQTAGALVERSARCWMRDLPPHTGLAIETRVLAPGEPPGRTVRVDAGGGAGVVSLPLAWFTDVWSRGVALVDDCFVTGRADGAAGAGTLPVLALRWEHDGRGAFRSVEAPAIVTRGDDGAFELQWL
jgi:hypothetical protein